MKRILILILTAIIAGVAYYTRPDAAAMEKAADAHFKAEREAQARDLDLKGLAKNAIGGLTREGTYKDLYVASMYTVAEDGKAILTCWGAFTRAMCPTSKS